MRRLLAAWIVVAVALAGVAVVQRSGGPEDAAYYLPGVLPVGLSLAAADVAQPGATLGNPLAYRRMLLRRPSDRIIADYVAAPADPDGRNDAGVFRSGERVPFGDGTAFVDHDRSNRVWWSTTRHSGRLSSVTVGTGELLAIARRFDRAGFVAPPGWKGLASFDPDSAIESIQYAGPSGVRSLHLVVHLHRHVVTAPVPEQTAPYAQRQLGSAVITAVAASADSGLTAADLRAVVDSVREVGADAWRSATGPAELDGRAVRWTPLARGRTASGAGWSLAVEDRGGERCLALLVVEQALGARSTCHAATWRRDPVLAVPTDRSGPVAVTANGRRLRAVGEARFEGKRIIVVELPADLWGQVIDPVAIVGPR